MLFYKLLSNDYCFVTDLLALGSCNCRHYVAQPLTYNANSILILNRHKLVTNCSVGGCRCRPSRMASLFRGEELMHAPEVAQSCYVMS